MNYIWLDECESTQLMAKQVLSKNVELPTLIQAGKQSAGRGRQGHSWISPQGGLFLSLIIPAPDRAVLTWAPLLVGVLAVEWAQELLGKQKSLKLKWPNDLVLLSQTGELKKWGGILCEWVGDSLIIGIGINYLNHPVDTDIQGLGSPGLLATSLQSMSAEFYAKNSLNIDIKTVGKSFASYLLEKMPALEEGLQSVPHFVRDRFLKYSAVQVGEQVEWMTSSGLQTAKFMGLGQWGEMLVENTEGVEQRLLSEEISVSKKA